MPPKRTRSSTKTKKKPSLSDIFDFYQEDAMEDDNPSTNNVEIAMVNGNQPSQGAFIFSFMGNAITTNESSPETEIPIQTMEESSESDNQAPSTDLSQPDVDPDKPVKDSIDSAPAVNVNEADSDATFNKTDGTSLPSEPAPQDTTSENIMEDKVSHSATQEDAPSDSASTETTSSATNHTSTVNEKEKEELTSTQQQQQDQSTPGADSSANAEKDQVLAKPDVNTEIEPSAEGDNTSANNVPEPMSDDVPVEATTAGDSANLNGGSNVENVPVSDIKVETTANQTGESSTEGQASTDISSNSTTESTSQADIQTTTTAPPVSASGEATQKSVPNGTATKVVEKKTTNPQSSQKQVSSTQEFIDILISSSLFPRPNLEQETIEMLTSGKKRDHWEREVDNLKEKIDMYRLDPRNEWLLGEILGLIQELSLDGNVSLLSNFFKKDEQTILSQIMKRKKIRSEITEEKMKEFEDEYFGRNNALDLLFKPNSNPFFSIPKEQADSMIVTLQFLIMNNEFIIKYGPQLQICHYNLITKSFLQEISSGILPSGLMESLEILPHVKFYNGSILVEIQDHRSRLALLNEKPQTIQNKLHQSPVRTTKLLLTPRSTTTLEHVKRFLNEGCPYTSEDERLEALRGIMVSMNPELDLDPRVSVLHRENAVHFNQTKHVFRRLITRTISRTLMPSNPAQTSMTIQSSMMRTRKLDHILLNYIANNGWKKDKLSDIRARPRGSVQPRQNFLKDITEEIDEKKRGLTVSSLVQLQKETQELTQQEQRKTVRILQFQAVNTTDQKRRWQVEVFPVHKGRRYDCIIFPSADPNPRLTIGSKHAAELYCDRLKDMFTSNGKTCCTTDTEMEYDTWEERHSSSKHHASTAQLQSQSTLPPSNQITPTQDRTGKSQPVPSPSYVQIRNNMRVQGGQMQTLSYNIIHPPPSQGVQGNIHAPHLHQVINQQQQRKQQ